MAAYKALQGLAGYSNSALQWKFLQVCLDFFSLQFLRSQSYVMKSNRIVILSLTLAVDFRLHASVCRASVPWLFT